VTQLALLSERRTVQEKHACKHRVSIFLTIGSACI
jgi:hypothetical protein